MSVAQAKALRDAAQRLLTSWDDAANAAKATWKSLVEQRDDANKRRAVAFAAKGAVQADTPEEGVHEPGRVHYLANVTSEV